MKTTNQTNKQGKNENILRTNSYTKNDIELVHQFWKSSECCHMKVFCIICFWHGTMSTMPKTNNTKKPHAIAILIRVSRATNTF